MKTIRHLFLTLAAVVRLLAAADEEEITLDLGGGVRLELVRIPEGDFQMGETEVTRNLIGLFAPHELRARQVAVTKAFYLGKYEITVEQFRRFIDASGYQTDAESGKRPWKNLTTGAYTVVDGKWTKKADASWKNPGFPQEANHPVTCISWNDAMEFCRWASRQTKRNVRLPTEAELEDAARAWTVTRYYWGNKATSAPLLSQNPSGERLGLGFWANVADTDMASIGDEDLFLDKALVMKTPIPAKRSDGHRYTAPVGSFYPNPFGLYDVIGNVWEYTLDWAGENPSGRDPRGADSAKLRTMRGGSWISTPDVFRPSYRAEIEMQGRTSTRGMRVLIDERP